MKISFNHPSVTDLERGYVLEALNSNHYSGDGPFTRRCHAFLERTLGVEKALLTTSCTHALEMCALLLDLQPGDEVIVPSFTFVSTANAFALRGATLVFADSRPDTLNVDETRLRDLITPRTRAIVVVHYAGVACDMEPILALAAEAGVPVIEDNAHGLFGTYKGRWLGSLGALATQSFHETKNFTCGEGGALLINEPRWIERAEILREKGTNRSRFFRGQIDKYSWVDLGSSYLPSDVLAAILLGQLERWQEIQSHRQHLWETYADRLGAWASSRGVRLPVVPEGCGQAWHMFYLLLPDLASRTHLIQHLKDHGILAVFHYLPLHLSEMGRQWGGKPGDCPVTEELSDRLIRLPFFHAMTSAQQMEIIDCVTRF
ncbi:MAG TPA: dTDP-4-amino-4,6-dideoxygalactose transaminase [Kiritimatiellia bacterium]|nr:dTDP-4-amino-4,6-dideoxygalactose transaminase [Kiritimatiellia bacterium]